MTHQEFDERLDTAVTKSSPDEAKQAIRELFVDVVGADVDLPNSIMPKHGQAMQNILKRKLRTTITGKGGGE